MQSFSESPAELEGFSGTAPLFPLPHVALFPHVTQPLHVFEPRYRELTADALSGERLIAIGALQPGWQADYESKHTGVHPVVCLGRIALDEQLPDGRYLLLLRGLCRARIVEEPETQLAYRTARLELLSDVYPAEAAIDRQRRRRELLEAMQALDPERHQTIVLLQQLESELSLGALCDVLAFALPAAADAGVRLLSTLNVDERSDLLLDELRRRRRKERAQPQGGFPPDFSAN
jgi:Lon protease-like protein